MTDRALPETSGRQWSHAAWRRHLPDTADPEALLAELGAASLPELAARSAEAVPDRIALRVDTESSTHRSLDDAAGRIAGWLASRIEPGDRVLLAGPSCLDFVRCYLGILRAGGVVVLANPAYTAAELAQLRTDSGAVLAFAGAEPARRLGDLPVVEFGALAEQLAGEPVAPVPGPDDNALLAYTSGTTGKPKGVPLTHRQLVVSIRAAMLAWRWSADDLLVHALPLFHQHGLGGVHATLIAGSRARLFARFDPAVLAEAAREATVLFAVPTMYERLVDQQAENFAGLRLCVCGSAPLSPQLASRVADTFGQLPLVRYGTTETGLDVSNPYAAARAETVGIPLPGVLVRIGESAEPSGVDGEIQLSGPQVFEGYWHNPEATAESFTADGWFRTGDIGQLDPASGHLVIRGRTKELIITGGLNVYPREVELALEQHDLVREAAVAGLADAHWGEQVTGWVVPSGEVSEADLLGHCRELLAPYKCPKRIYFIDALPRNQMGKIARSELDTPAGLASARATRDQFGAFSAVFDSRALPGVPIAVKDLFDIAGHPVRSGTSGFAWRDAEADSAAVARLHAAGYRVIGQTSTPALAWSVRTPGCGNPWDAARDAGGSSGGSAAAVAAGVVDIALGSDTGGSIRVPAALCGVAGLRPTVGAIDTRGLTPLAPSMDTVGPIARTAADCLRVHGELGGQVRPVPESVAGLRVGWPAMLWADRVEPEVARVVTAAADRLVAAGAELVELRLPAARQHARGAAYTILLAESAKLWWDTYRAEPAGLDSATVERLRAGSEISDVDYQRARGVAAEVTSELDAAFGQVSALLLPTVPVTAARAETTEVRLADRPESVDAAYVRLTGLASVTGFPALSVPVGLAANGLPVGAQLIGPRHAESLLCLLAGSIEQASGNAG
ncbi:acyl-CoA synthetase (AMP-forming)/AMP-acid ligase II [Tamaricihabitans halophyticus]|uniref:Acyl-CoA synthetase (AMP-forming)/AMP-acid ligase II n=1 Tax=Tamaricihabitans halophyticus TaxID=1262583 RepID=A0A4R2R5K0_9PSEU|nr:amidase family protein [Tamaricihabitans halophyticus]TCP57038.1 acyl-CoA synthetase (AMP-forming)/AMP-acid ligase II [Tamaricihabitans halophyticus]